MNSKCETCMWMRHSPMGHMCARGLTIETMIECECRAYNKPRESNQVDLEERIEDLETQLGWYEEELDNLRNFCRRVDQFLCHFPEFSLDCDIARNCVHSCCPLNAGHTTLNNPDNWHVGDNFCGNCAHCDHGKQGDDTIYICVKTGEILDPDWASCEMFEHPF